MPPAGHCIPQESYRPSVVIIFLHPFLSQYLYLHGVLEKIGIQYIFSEYMVEPLNISVLNRSAGLDKLS